VPKIRPREIDSAVLVAAYATITLRLETG